MLYILSRGKQWSVDPLAIGVAVHDDVIKIKDSWFKHRLFSRNTDIHIYTTIMDTWQNIFLNGNII